jgi:membrane fusion protein, multidrug efflux system
VTLVIQIRVPTILLLCGLLTACGGGDDQKGAPNSNGQQAVAQTPPGGPEAGGGAGGRPGGRGPQTVTLASTDVSPVRRGSVEDAVAVTGNLQPLERIEVRARLEGELEDVLVREGQYVAQGQLMARFEANQQASGMESAQADVEAAQTELSTAKWNLDQTRELFKEGAVPERDVKAGEQQVSSATARKAAADSRLRAASEALRDTRVLAPAAAVVEKRAASNGEHVNRGVSLFTLVRTQILELTGAVPARDANLVRPGQTVRFSADAREFIGRVARINPSIDPASRSVAVYIQIPNADGSLKGGTFANGRIISRVAENVLIIPTNAIKQELNTGEPYVYRISGETVERQPIQLGLIDEARAIAEVTDGLEEGDRIVTGSITTTARSAKVVIVGGESRGGRGGQQQRGGGPPPIPRTN